MLLQLTGRSILALKDLYLVRLSPEQRQELERLAATGKRSAATLTRTRILLKADADGDGAGDEQITEALDVSLATVARVRKKLVQRWLGRAPAPVAGRSYRKMP